MVTERHQVHLHQAIVALILFSSTSACAVTYGRCPVPMNSSLPGPQFITVLNSELCGGFLNPHFGIVTASSVLSNGGISITSTGYKGTTNGSDGGGSGAVDWTQPIAGVGYTLTVLNFKDYQNPTVTAQTIPLGSPYASNPAVLGAGTAGGISITCSVVGLLSSTTTVILPSSMNSSFTGQCFLEGQ